MKLGLIPINIGLADAGRMIGLAQAAEQAGFESVWTFEHVIVPLDYQSRYPYAGSGKMPASPDTPFIDPLIALTAIAAATRTLRLGTGVNILSQANPLLLAKQAASLDVVSGGRLLLGLGIGWLREEFDAMGVPFERRGARFDDYVKAMRKVWSGKVVEHESEFLQWHGFKSHPVPSQSPLPVIMGGNKGRILERIARYGNGWYLPDADPLVIRQRLIELKQVCDVEQRDFDDLEITAMWSARGGLETIEALADAGVHRAVVPLMALGSDPLAGIEQVRTDIISKLT